MKLHVVDSSAWLEYFADGPAADQFAPIIEQPAALIVPVERVVDKTLLQPEKGR